jgi:hypothetical protein
MPDSEWHGCIPRVSLEFVLPTLIFEIPLTAAILNEVKVVRILSLLNFSNRSSDCVVSKPTRNIQKLLRTAETFAFRRKSPIAISKIDKDLPPRMICSAENQCFRFRGNHRMSN